MKQIKRVLAGVAVSAAAAVAHASPINVGGVVFDPDAGIDFSAASVSVRQFINPTTGEVSGFGTINTINGDSTFCAAAGCELTFQFSGFVPSSPVIPSVSGGTILYSLGTVTVYVDNSPEVANSVSTNMTAASTGDGNPWLILAGHSFDPDGAGPAPARTFAGTAVPDGFGGVSTLVGGGLLDVLGGIAAGNLNTNTKQDGADFTFTNSFSTFINNSLLDSIGTGNFNGNAIPEPGTLALLGVAMVGLGVARRRQSSK